MERPPLKLTVKLDEGEKEIKMSYSLFNDLQRVCGEPEMCLTIMTQDAHSRDYLVRRCLTDKKKIITDVEDLISMEEVGLDDPDEVQKILHWVAGHVLYFFATSADGLKQLGAAFKAHVETANLPAEAQPDPSKSGSKD